MSTAAERRGALVAELWRIGALTRTDVARAFAAVPREVFVSAGFHAQSAGAPDGAAGGPGLVTRVVDDTDDAFLSSVYRNVPLITKLADGVPVSSSSQPSLMATMIEALQPAPGMRVLEIGTGTGYNAALLTALGVRVTSVDVQDDVVRRAATALDRSGVGAVDVRLGDGYLGVPDGAPYHRVLVTVGVSGISPHWLAQLAPAGFILAPVAHAGNHPVLRVRPGTDGTVRAEGCAPAGFMCAAGPLAADYPWAHPRPLPHRLPPAPTLRYPPPWPAPLPLRRYLDLCFAAGAWDRRVTTAVIDEVPGPAAGCVVLAEDGAAAGAAGLLPDGSVVAQGPQARRYARIAAGLRDRWIRHGRPRLDQWQAWLVPAGEPARPIRVPTGWTLVGPPDRDPVEPGPPGRGPARPPQVGDQ